MNDEQMLEVRIESQDPDLIAEVESALAEVNAKRWEKTRDLVTVLSIASSAVALVTALLDLKERLEKKAAATKVYVLNVDRKQLAIAEATEVALTDLIKSEEP
jgi:hypothetical protein